MATPVLDAPVAGVDDSARASEVSTPPHWVRWATLAAIVAVALVIRWQFIDFETMDYQAFLSRWYDTLDAGGLSALKERFADYNYPYLYLLWLLTCLNIPSLIGVKLISVVFELLLAFFAYRIVSLKSDRFWLRALAFGIVLLLPSVIANGSLWGQADAVYSAFAVGGVYFLMRAQATGELRWNSWWACVFFGLALSFKLQAIFVLPVLAFVLLRRKLPWYTMVAIPAVYLLLDVPALTVGAPWREVLSVYLEQTDSYKQLTLGAANLYQLIPVSGDVTWLAHLGIGCAAAIIAVFLGWSVWRRPPVTPTAVLLVATASALIVPFLLPSMHDRYFYIGEILSVLLAFYLPLRYIVIPLLVHAAATGVYHASLTGDQGQSFGAGGASGGPGPHHPGGGHRPSGGGPSGRPGGGHGPGGGNGYSSGRGDTALTIYASMMALAIAGVVAALVRFLPGGERRAVRAQSRPLTR